MDLVDYSIFLIIQRFIMRPAFSQGTLEKGSELYAYSFILRGDIKISYVSYITEIRR